MLLFYILYTINVIVALIVLYFFFIGLADGSVSSFNGGIWFCMLAVTVAMLVGTLYLKSIDKVSTANTLLAVVAVPAVLAGVVMLFLVIAKPKWN